MDIELLQITEEERKKLAGIIAREYTKYSSSHGVKGNYDEEVKRLLEELFEHYMELSKKPYYHIKPIDIDFLGVKGYADINCNNDLYLEFTTEGLRTPPLGGSFGAQAYTALAGIPQSRRVIASDCVYDDEICYALLSPALYREAVIALKPEISKYLKERRKELREQRELVKRGNYDVEEQILKEHVKKKYAEDKIVKVHYSDECLAVVSLYRKALVIYNNGWGKRINTRRVLDKVLCLYSGDSIEETCTYIEERIRGGRRCVTFMTGLEGLTLEELTDFVSKYCKRGEGNCFEKVRSYVHRLVAFEAI